MDNTNRAVVIVNVNVDGNIVFEQSSPSSGIQEQGKRGFAVWAFQTLTKLGYDNLWVALYGVMTVMTPAARHGLTEPDAARNCGQ